MVKVDRRIRWHYTTTILRLRIGARLTGYRNCKFHNFARTISRHADGISRYSVPPSAGPLLPLPSCKVNAIYQRFRYQLSESCLYARASEQYNLIPVGGSDNIISYGWEGDQWRIQDFCKGGAAAGAFGVPQAPSCPLSLRPLRKFRGS